MIASVPHQIQHPIGQQIHLRGYLGDLRVATEPSLQRPTDGADLVDLFGDMHRKSDGFGLVGRYRDLIDCRTHQVP